MSEYIVDLTPKLYTDLRFRRGEQIVRCRDCKFFDARGNMGQWCTLLEFGKKNIANGFCAWGERREDG